MRGSEIVIMESVQREDGRCESFTEHDEPVMELHTEWKHQAMPGSPVTEITSDGKISVSRVEPWSKAILPHP